MTIQVHFSNEKIAKAFMAAKPANVDAKDVTIKVAGKDLKTEEKYEA